MRSSNPFLMNVLKKIATPAKVEAGYGSSFRFRHVIFSWPEFNVDINSMNSLSKKTLMPEKLCRHGVTFPVNAMFFWKQQVWINCRKKNCSVDGSSLSDDVRQEKLEARFFFLLFYSRHRSRQKATLPPGARSGTKIALPLTA